MRIQILLSCMHQTDTSIIERSNIQCDAIIVNQCDKEAYEVISLKNKSGKEYEVIFISTKERGLSKSRNMALHNSTADICIIADDDMVYPNNIEEIVMKQYEKCETDIKLFALKRKDSDKRYPIKTGKVQLMQILKTSSPQITFKREKIESHKINFDEKMGSGTGNGGGEEVKFLLDCKRKHLSIDYTPVILGEMMPSDGQWFRGITIDFMRDLGWTSRRILGNIKGYAYIWYQTIVKYPKYKKENSFFAILKAIHEGYFEQR